METNSSQVFEKAKHLQEKGVKRVESVRYDEGFLSARAFSRSPKPQNKL